MGDRMLGTGIPSIDVFFLTSFQFPSFILPHCFLLCFGHLLVPYLLRVVLSAFSVDLADKDFKCYLTQV